MDAKQGMRALLKRMHGVASHGPDRAVFLCPDGSPEPSTRRMGQQLYDRGGDAEMQKVGNMLILQ